jgi:ATP-dependent helicase/DNAse subunit B
MTYIGNLFHYILSICFKDDFDFDKEFNNYIDNTEFTKKEEFFINKLKQDLIFTINTIKKQDLNTSLNNALYEQKIYVNMDGNVKVTFMGIIDKLKYETFDNKTIVAIIDYKTGNPNINLNNVIYGLDMQLPIYLYLSKNSSLENVEVAGFYLQKIIHNKVNYEENKTLDEIKEKEYKLEGYSNSNEEILSKLDKNYNDSNMIKGMKTSSKGFYAYSKILNKEELEKLYNLTEEKIEETKDNIIEAKFDINPKKVGFNLLGCEYCKFNDICYKKEDDIISLEEKNYKEFLGGDNNA